MNFPVNNVSTQYKVMSPSFIRKHCLSDWANALLASTKYWDTRKPLNAEKTLPPNPVQTARMGQTTPGTRPPRVGLVCPQAPLKAP